jgi:hypothetical protein
MSVLRKKYFSIQSNSFIDIPTTANASFSSSDVGNVYTDETVRLIKFGDDVDSSKLDQTFIDLIHNDNKLFSEYQKINSLISNGSFYQVGDNFQVFDIKKDLNEVEGTYIKSFGIKSGQIKYNDEIIFLEPTSFYTTVQTTVSGGNTFNVSTATDLNSFQNSIGVGSVIFGSEFEDGTQVIGITGTAVKLSKNLKTNYTLNSGSLVLFMNVPTFEVGQQIDEIPNGDLYPIYRRDLISYNIKKSRWEIFKGIEVSNFIPPINTQLDVIYQIESVTHVSGIIHQLKLKKNNRDISNDFISNVSGAINFLKISKSDNKTFDGEFEISSIDETNFTINVKIPLYRDNINNQIEPGGFIDLKTVGVLSILVYKTSDNATSIVVDSIENITSIAGITGGIQNILRAPINHYNSYFSIKTNDKIHLVDIKGRLLDWEEGQGKITDPVLGYDYNETKLINYGETNIPHDYTDISEGNLTNIPFILNEIQNNIFGLKFVDVISFNIGIKNNSISIGQEGITYKITSYDQLTDNLKVSFTDTPDINTKYIKIIRTDDINDFTTIGIQTVTRKDFILISQGQGNLQIGKIINVTQDELTISGLFKDIDTTSEFIIFKNIPQAISDSQYTIESELIKSQVLSGINGSFGEQSIYSKVSLLYPDTEILTQIPKIESSKWYFLSLKGYNDLSINGLQQGTPYIVTEDLLGESNSSSSFIEIFYRTISGNYPDNILIEDEFGDINVQRNARAEAPHFRPVKYQILARALDQITTNSQQLDEVFLDVHVGVFKFHPDAIPRRVFVSYNKYDVIDGNSTDFSIKHTDINDQLKINLQDKISDINYKLQKENEVEKAWKVNGLISNENFGFSGPITVNINDSYNIVYKDPEFTNFSFDEEKYIVKFSNHLYDKPIYIGNDNILLENLSLEKDLNSTEDFTEGTLVNDFDFLDYSPGASANTLPFIGINFFDESFVPTNDGFFSSVSDFYRKKLIFETPNEKSEMSIDTGLYDINYLVNSRWNYLYPMPFEQNMALYGLLRKKDYEFASYVSYCNLDIKRRLRQREFIKLLDKDLNDINSNKSVTKIISEKYLSKSLVLDSVKYKENSLYLKSEITKYKFYEFLRAQNSEGTTLGLSDNLFPIIGNYDSEIKRSTLFINNSSITAFKSYNGSRPKIKIINFVKSEDTSDLGALDLVQVANEILVEDIECSEIRACNFNEKYFAVGYVIQVNNQYYIKIKLYDTSGNYLENSAAVIGNPDFPIASPFIFEIGDIGINRIGIVYQRSITEIGLITYNYSPLKQVTITDIKIIDSENTLSTYPSICKFSTNSFMVAYSNIYGSKIKIFDQDGKLQFFDDNETIDYRTLTTNHITITGNIIKLIELDNNDIAILFLDKGIAEKYDLKLVILDSWEKNWKYPQSTSINASKSLSIPIYVEQGLTTKIESIGTCILNEDIFIVSYTKNGKINLKAFYNDGGQLYNSFEDTLTNITNLNLLSAGQSTVFITYINSDNSYKYSVYNFRPNFIKNINKNNNFEISNYTNNYFFQSHLFDNNNYLLLRQTTVTTYNISIVSTIKKDVHQLNSYYTALDGISLSNGKILDTYFVNKDVLKVLLIVWSDSSNIYVEFIKISSTGSITKSPNKVTISPSANYSKNFGKIIDVNLDSNVIGVVLKTNTKKYNIHGISLLPLLTSNDFGTPFGTNYTSNAKIYNPAINSLSGVEYDYTVSFIKKDNYGYLVYPSSSGTNIGALNLSNSLFDSQGELNFTNLSSINFSSPINSNRAYSGINFVKDKNLDNRYFIFGNSSGSGDYYDVNFNNTLVEGSTFFTMSASGTFISASGTFKLLDEPQPFNSSYDESLLLFYNNSSGSSNYHNVVFFNKDNYAIIDTVPKTTFNETSLGNRFYTIKSDDIDDYYSTFTSSSGTINKLYSKTISLSFTDKIEYERVLTVKEDSLSDSANRQRLYLNNSIKIGGINWKGQIVKNYPVYSIPSFNLDSEYIDDDKIFRSEKLLISAHLVSISKDSFTVIYYYHKNKSSELKVKLRNFVISRSRVFPSSKWYDNEISFESNSNLQQIYLQVIEYGDNLLYIWIDPITKKINKCLVDSTNSIITGTNNEIENQLSSSSWILLGSSKLIEGWSTVIGYEKNTNKLYTMLFNPDGNLHRLGIPFDLPFDIRTSLRSNVNISKFGYFYWLFFDSSTNKLKYYQHGFDGDPWGCSQLVGKNYITNIQTSSNSPIYNQIKDDILNTEEIKFLQYNKIDVNLNNGFSKDIYDVFGSQETGIYRIFDLNDPTINVVMALKVVSNNTLEPIITLDTSSSNISKNPGTANKFNIYISSATNYVTFQNNTGNIMNLRFYKEN